ncbi:hypothetical protein ES703_120298 [subsurface metagenome]
MRVVVIVTIDGKKETRIEGECLFMSGQAGDKLEQQGLGVWLHDWQENPGKGAHHKSRVFVPWTSCLYIETKD